MFGRIVFLTCLGRYILDKGGFHPFSGQYIVPLNRTYVRHRQTIECVFQGPGDSYIAPVLKLSLWSLCMT